MKTYDYDAFGHPLPVPTTANGKLQVMATATVFLYCDGIHDPMLTRYYPVARHHGPALGRFSSFESHEGKMQPPAGLQKYQYGGQIPIDFVDPGEIYAPPAEKLVCRGA